MHFACVWVLSESPITEPCLAVQVADRKRPVAAPTVRAAVWQGGATLAAGAVRPNPRR